MERTITKQISFPQEMVSIIESRAENFGYNFSGYVRYLLTKEMEKEFERKEILDANMLSDIKKGVEEYKRGKGVSLKNKKEIEGFLDSLCKEDE